MAKQDAPAKFSIAKTSGRYDDNSLCGLSLHLVKHRTKRRVFVSLDLDAGELCYAADVDDLIAMREWLNAAIAHLAPVEEMA